MLLRFLAPSVAGALAISGAAAAQDYYVSLSGGGVFLGDSDNDGAFDGAFTTGAGTTVTAGAVLPDGTAVGWTTDFNPGWALNGAVGKDYGWLRAELEVAYQRNGVDSHSGVTAGGIALDNEDAAVLITGQATNLGVTVGDLVADGQGDVRTIFVMANAIAEFENASRLTPYIGGGVGVGFVNVDYSPSATPIIDDSATAFAYQAMAGVGYELAPQTTLFAGYRYRATLDPNVDASLFSANFDIENRASIFEAGLRFTF